MTLQDVKNKIAQEHGFDDWWAINFNVTNLSQEVLRDMVAMKYAREKVKEQRDITAKFLAQNFNMRNIERPNFDL